MKILYQNTARLKSLEDFQLERFLLLKNKKHYLVATLLRGTYKPY